MTESDFSVLVLAGERHPGADPLARAAGTASKVLVPIAGTPVIDRTVAAIESAADFRSRVLAGPPAPILNGHAFLADRVADHRWQWIDTGASPATTVATALRHAAPPPALITSADHGFLNRPILRHFLTAAIASGSDAAIGFARLSEVNARFPQTRRTGWRFQDDTYCGCNLFAFTTPASINLARLWQQFEADRKRPWAVMRALGPNLLIRYLTRRLTLSAGLSELGRRAECTIAPIVLPFPQAAVDVDSIADWQFVNAVWADVSASDP